MQKIDIIIIIIMNDVGLSQITLLNRYMPNVKCKFHEGLQLLFATFLSLWCMFNRVGGQMLSLPSV
jgi:hypothetical protein